MKALITAVTLTATLFTAPAMAWGDREQGILTGIVVGEIFRSMQEPKHVGTIQPHVTHSRGGYIDSRRAHSYNAMQVCRTERQYHDNIVVTVEKNCRGQVINVLTEAPRPRY